MLSSIGQPVAGAELAHQTLERWKAESGPLPIGEAKDHAVTTRRAATEPVSHARTEAWSCRKANAFTSAPLLATFVSEQTPRSFEVPRRVNG